MFKEPGPVSTEEDRSLHKYFIFSSEGSKHAVHQKLFQEYKINSQIMFDKALKRRGVLQPRSRNSEFTVVDHPTSEQKGCSLIKLALWHLTDVIIYSTTQHYTPTLQPTTIPA